MQILNVSILEELGRGTSGVVYKVRNPENKNFVVKVIDFSKLCQKKQLQSMKEVEILKTLSHPHIIRYHSSVLFEKSLYIMTEFAAGGDLQKRIDRHKQTKRLIEEGQIWSWVYEISLALSYLHRHKVLHRDLKCMNIFLDKDSHIKIGDFGLAKVIQSEIKSSTIGTPLYLSPEQIKHLPYGFKADVWAVGCVIYKLCTLEPPFTGESLQVLGHNIVNKSYKPLPSKFTPKLSSIISQLLEKNSKTRLGVSDLLESIPVFTKKFYKPPVFIKLQEKNASPTETRITEIPSCETVFPRFTQQGFCGSLGPFKRLLIYEQRPISQGTTRVFQNNLEAFRISTALVRQRVGRTEKCKTTIADLAKIM